LYCMYIYMIQICICIHVYRYLYVYARGAQDRYEQGSAYTSNVYIHI